MKESFESLAGLPTLTLGPGQSLSSEDSTTLRFASGVDGVRLTADNRVSGLTLVTDPTKCAVSNNFESADFGLLELSSLRVHGCVRLLAQGNVRQGHIRAADVFVEAADARGFAQRASAYGVQVIPGAFTVWNLQSDPTATITAEFTGISAGRAGGPVEGSGVLIGGSPGGGRTIVARLETGEIHSRGRIAPGTADRISGCVFVLQGAHVHEVRNRGPVTTEEQDLSSRQRVAQRSGA